jgi:hypothetical protein
MSRFVYIGFDGTKKYFKIGITGDIRRREKEIRNMNPTFKMMYYFEPDQVKAWESEQYLHNRFADKRVAGEWFELSVDDIMVIIGARFPRSRIEATLGRVS